jgi:glycosyltransferase involved in cell wall biosynthesis
MRLLIIGTHPSQTTGYSKVVYNIVKQLEHYPEIECTVFGIQKFSNVNDDIRNKFPKNVRVWNVVANDKEDFGFGTNSLIQFVTMYNPDVVLIYNDSEVISKYMMNLEIAKNKALDVNMQLHFKIAVYLDQVHTSLKKETVRYISENADHVFCFTEFWRQNYLKYIKSDELRNKCSVVRHGIEILKSYQPDQDKKHKIEFGFPEDAFIFLNLNRFALKKRLDISVQAFVKLLKKTDDDRLYLYFPAIIDSDVNILLDIYYLEIQSAGLSLAKFKDNLKVGNKQLSDEDISKIYSFCDVGLNTCDGEGFGLCNYEHASYGRPQILSKVGGLMDYFNDNNSLMCVPKVVAYSLNFERGEVVNADDVSEKMEKYYKTRSFYNKHGNIVREIPNNYKWKDEINKMMTVLLSL